jgi:hypothetical protein
VPVNEVSLTANNIRPALGGSVTFSVGVGYSTVREYGYTIVGGEEYTESFAGDVLTVKSSITAQNPVITVYATCGGVKSNEVTIYIQIPAIGISYSVTSFSVDEGTTVVLPAPTVTPNNATDKDCLYSVVSGGEYMNGTIANGQFKIKDTISVSNAQIKVRVTLGGKSVDLTYNIVVTVKTLSILPSAAQLTSTSSGGASLTLTPTFNAGLTAPTSTAITYYISEGLEYVDASVISSDNILYSNTLTVKSGVAVPNGVIKVYAIAGGKKSDTVTVSIYVPIEGLTFDEAALSRGMTTSLTPRYNSGASTPTYAAWGVVKRYVDNAETTDDGKISVSVSANTIFISKTLTYGTTIKLTYRAKDADGNASDNACGIYSVVSKPVTKAHGENPYFAAIKQAKGLLL